MFHNQKVASMRIWTMAIVTLSTGILLQEVAEGGMVFYDRSDFLAASGQVKTEGFESHPIGLTSGTSSRTFDDFEATFFVSPGGSSFQRFGVSDGITSSRAPTAGTRYLLADLQPGRSLTFTFQYAISEFGTDIRDLEGPPFVVMTSGGEASETGPPAGNGAVQFFGFIAATPFQSITFQTNPTSTSFDGLVFDEVAYSATAVPEPASMSLFGIGASIMGIVAARRRRSEQKSGL